MELSTTDKDGIREYTEFAKKYPQIHGTNYGGIEWVVEPRRNPVQNINKVHSMTQKGIEEINLVIAPDLREIRAREFGR